MAAEVRIGGETPRHLHRQKITARFSERVSCASYGKFFDLMRFPMNLSKIKGTHQ